MHHRMICYHATHDGVPIDLTMTPQEGGKYNLSNCMALLVGQDPINDHRAGERMFKEIDEELQCNVDIYDDVLSRPSSTRTPIRELMQLEAFANIYSCSVTLWGVTDEERRDCTLVQLGVAQHGGRIHHIIYRQGIFNPAHVAGEPVNDPVEQHQDDIILDCTQGQYVCISINHI